MAVDRDTVFIASPREDDVFSIVNTDSQYPDRTFSVSQALSIAPHEQWLDYLDAKPVKRRLWESRGDWSNYVKAAALRFALVKKAQAEQIVELLNREYYDLHGYEHSATIYTPSSGSAVLY